MNQLKIKTPAKLNLFLHVLRKRPDNYHDIFSLFHKIALHDELTFRKVNKPGCKIISSSKKIPRNRNNLISKAYQLLVGECGVEGGLSVRVKKNIPVAGGLGGGSSDAAATLVAVNQLYGLRKTRKQLQNLALKIGADVPFFLTNEQSALVGGIGEKIKPLEKIGSYYFLIIQFSKGLKTPVVYEGLGLTPTNANVRIPRISRCNLKWEQLRNCLRNDLMISAFKLYPLVRKVYEFIRQSGYTVLQTGSGPTLFVIHPKRDSLIKLRGALQRGFRLKTTLTQSL